jgi:hypothetical protein
MKRRFAIGLLVALVLVVGISAMAMAAGPGPAYGNGGAAGYAGQGALISESFVDADGDGVCDNYVDRVPLQDGTGNQWGAGTGTPGANFVDANGDGLCDNCLNGGTQPQDGTGMQMRQGGRWNR